MGAVPDAAPQQRWCDIISSTKQTFFKGSICGATVARAAAFLPTKIGVLAGNGNALDVPLQLSAQLQGRALFLAILVACAARLLPDAPLSLAASSTSFRAAHSSWPTSPHLLQLLPYPGAGESRL